MMWARVVLPRPGRPVEQDVVQRLAAGAGGLDQDAQILAQPVLADHLAQGPGPQRGINHDFLGPALRAR